VQHTLRAYPHTYQQQRIAEVLDLCKLTHLQYKLPRELSGGEQQRATLARALADEPELLLLDEPFSHLDSPLKRQIKKEVAQILRASGITAILVTHDTIDALSMAGKVALMQHGHVIQTDIPQKIYSQPATPYVAQFFGEANILDWKTLQPYLPGDIHIPIESPTKVCLRAEDISIATTDHVHCRGTIKSISYFGAYSSAEVQVNKHLTLIFNAPADIKVGMQLPLVINAQKIHFFSREYQKT
jgi:iron(III) transport system ATP-binding protein